MKQSTRKFFAAALAFSMLFNSNTTILANTNEGDEPEVTEQPELPEKVNEEGTPVEGQPQVTPEATPNESVAPQETEQEDSAAQTPAAEGTEPTSEPTATPEATPEEKEAEGTDSENEKEEEETASWNFVGVFYCAEDGTRFEEALPVTAETKPVSEYAKEFEGYTWTGSASINQNPISALSNDSYTISNEWGETKISCSEYFSVDEVIYVEFPYTLAQQEELAEEEIKYETHFEYEDDRVKVSADAAEQANLPEDAEIHADYLTPGSSEYLKAVALILRDTDTDPEKTTEFELYDIYFTSGENRIEPNDYVRVNLNFKQTITPNADNGEVSSTEVVHVDNENNAEVIENSDVVTSSEGIEEVTFTNNTFSLYGVKYTVDYTYNGFTWSMGGGEQIYLSDLFTVLGINEDANTAESVEFTNYDLISVEPRVGNALLTSLQPFDTNETLTVKLSNGNTYVIGVTDDNENSEGQPLTGLGTVTVEKSTSIEEQRDAQVSFSVYYTISDLKKAKSNLTWIYDLSELVGADASKVFTNLINAQGAIIDAETQKQAGAYYVSESDGKVRLEILEAWINEKTSDARGYFTFQGKLNESHNWNTNSETVVFPGNSEVIITYENKKLDTSKGVGTVKGSYDSDGQTVQMVENSDGTYSLYYQVTATPTGDMKTFSVADKLAGGQVYDSSSFVLTVDGVPYSVPVGTNAGQVIISGESFNLDVEKFLENNNVSVIRKDDSVFVAGGKTYSLTYQTNLPKTVVEGKTSQTNTMDWTWDVGVNTATTTVTPKFDKKIELNKAQGLKDGEYNVYDWAQPIVEPDENGKVSIFYDLVIKPNTSNINILKIEDTLNVSSAVFSNSIELYEGDELIGSLPIVSSNNGFSANVKQYLEQNGRSIKANSEYHVRYSIKIGEDDLAQQIVNTAKAIWDGEPVTKEIHIKPEIKKEIIPSKGVGNQYNQDKTSGNVIVVKDGETGLYKLYYKITATTTSSTSSLKITDEISGGQQYVTDSFKIQINSENARTINIPTTDSGFTYDVKNYFGGKVPAGTYTITYQTTVTEAQLGTLQSNNAKWEWDYDNPEENHTGVYPIPEPKITKSAKNQGEDVGNNQKKLKPGDIVDFTVSVGLDDVGNPVDMAGYHIYDTISNYGVLVGAVKISPEVDDVSELSGSELDGKADGTTKKVYDFTFPTEKEYKSATGYTITYSIQLSENIELNGEKDLLNIAYFGDISARTNTKVDYGAAGTTVKSFSKWDEDNNKIYWYIDVDVTEGKTLHNLFVTDFQMQYGSKEWIPHGGDEKSLSFDWNSVTVTSKENPDNPIQWQRKTDTSTETGSHVANRDAIYFESLSESVRIEVATISPVSFDSLSAYYAYNKANVHSDEGVIGTPDAKTNKFTPKDYKFTKSGVYDQENNIATWTVVINDTHNSFDPDIIPYFRDTIPNGMEFVADSKGQCWINVKLNNGSYEVYGNSGINLPVQISDRVVTIPDGYHLGDGFYYYDEWKHANRYELSGNSYVVTYQTRITDDYLDQIRDPQVITEQQFTNVAELIDKTGATLKRSEDTVEYKYSNLISKSTGDLILNEYIPYTVVVNPESKKIHDGSNYTVSDTIPTNVDFYIGALTAGSVTHMSPSVKDADGNDLLNSGAASVNYVDDTRTITFSVPDEKEIIIEFIVRARENGESVFKNSVELQANVSDSSETSRSFNITKSDAGIAANSTFVSLHKIDKNQVLKNLPGAEFELYLLNTPGITRKGDGTVEYETKEEAGEIQYYAKGDGKIISETLIGTYTTNSNGIITFPDLKPYYAYYWIETKAAPGYKLSNPEKHYFVAYPIGVTSTQTVENSHYCWAVDNTVTRDNSLAYVASTRAGYSWLVTNEEDDTKSNLTVTKKILKNDEQNLYTGAEGDKFYVSIYQGSDRVGDVKEISIGSNGVGTVTFEALTIGETYTVKETDASGKVLNTGDRFGKYTVVSTGANITINSDGSTNKAEIVNKVETVDIPVTKEWDDNNSKQSRPKELVYKLLQNGKEYRTQTVTSTTNYSYTFENLEKYDSNGEPYIYTVQEGTVLHYITVVTPEGTGFKIKNTYNEQSAHVEANKELNGRELKAGEFEFVLKGTSSNTGKEEYKATNDSYGKVVFGTIDFNEAGTYEYELYEENNKISHISYSNKKYKVRIIVDANEDGSLNTPVVKYYENTDGDLKEAEPAFKNEYIPESTSAHLTAKKTISNWMSTKENNDKFSFKLVPIEAAPMPEGKDSEIKEVVGQNSANFSDITFTSAGIFKYSIEEIPGTMKYYKYSDDKYEVSVQIVDNAGKLEVKSIKYSLNNAEKADAEFINEYNPTPVEVSLQATKKFTTGNLEKAIGNTFTFTLTDESEYVNTKELTISRDENKNKIPFDTLKFTKVGTYSYKIYENQPTDARWVKDNHVYNAVITVTDVDGKGSLTAVTKIDNVDNTNVTFTNDFKQSSVTLYATKIVSDYPAGLTCTDEFEFKLSPVNGAPMPTGLETETKNIRGSGSVSFTTINYEQSGTYKYKIEEIIPPLSKFHYECLVNQYDAIVTVDESLNATVKYQLNDEEKDSAVFTNKYSPSPVNVILKANKTFTEDNLTNAVGKKFAFTLSDGKNSTDTEELEIKDNPNLNNITFDELSFASAGEYKYTITENSTSYPGWIVDKTVYNVLIKVTDSGNGKLEAATTINGNPTTEVTFKNDYQLDIAEAEIPVKKKLIGFPKLSDGATYAATFKFVLKGNDDNPEEQYGSNFSREASITLGRVGDQRIVENETKFLYDGASSKFPFSKIGTYKFSLVEEENDTLKGHNYKFSTAKYGIEITVVMGEDGHTLKVNSINYTREKGTGSEEETNGLFINSYTPTDVTGDITIHKGFWDDLHTQAPGYLPIGVNTTEYKFTIRSDASKGKPYYENGELYNKEVSINFDAASRLEKDGGYKWTSPKFKEPGDYYFNITENAVNEPGVISDSTTYSICFHVEDHGTGRLIVYSRKYINGEYRESLSYRFRNEYLKNYFVNKLWNDNNNQDGIRPDSIRVRLMANGVQKEIVELNGQNEWSYRWQNLPSISLDSNKKPIDIFYSVEEVNIPKNYEGKLDENIITNSHKPETTNIEFIKTWVDENNQDGKRPEKIVVQLYQKIGNSPEIAVEGKRLELTASNKLSENRWKGSFNDLPKYNSGKLVQYIVREMDGDAPVYDNGKIGVYTANYNNNNITNFYTPETTTATVVKKWVETAGHTELRPSEVKVRLVDDTGKTIKDNISLNESNGWTFTVTGLPKYRSGQIIKYSFIEIKPVFLFINKTVEDMYDDHYRVAYSDDGQTITNSLITGDLSVTKTVQGDKADKTKKFEFTIKLSEKLSGTYGDVEFEEGVATFKLGNGETVKATGLPINIKYTVTEEEEGYKATKSGDTGTIVEGKTVEAKFTNTKEDTPPTPTPTPTPTPSYTSVDINAKKVWDDNNNANGKRPSKVRVHLLANGVDTGYVAELSEANNWFYTWYALPLNNEDGNFVTYDVVEEGVDGYTSSVSGDMYGGYTITNTNKKKSPKTDDTFHVFGWAVSLIASMIASLFAALMLRRKK